MTVRDINGGTDIIRWTASGMAGTTFGTYACLVKVDDTASFRTAYCWLSSTGAYILAPMQFDGSDNLTWDGAGGVAGVPMGVWLTLVGRKTTGTTTPRWSYFNHSTQAWTHVNSSATHADHTALAATDQFAFGTGNTGGGESFDGRAALVAGWKNFLPWSPDAAGDALLEAAGLHLSLENWVLASPNQLVRIDQQDVTDNVFDMITPATQTGRTATTVVTNDDPPGFSFAYNEALWLPQAPFPEVDTPVGIFQPWLGSPAEAAVGGPQVIAVGQVIEEEIAQSVGKAKKRWLGSKTVTETFDKADGSIGPVLAPWTRRVFTNTHAASVVSNRLRMTVNNDPGTYEDLQEPSLLVDGVDYKIVVEIPTASHTGASGDFVADGAGIFREALHTGDTDYRGYAFGFGLNNVFFAPAITYHLAIFRVDAVGVATLLAITLSTTANLTLPATLTAWMVEDRINIRVTHGGPGPPLEVFAKESTYTDGKPVWGGSVQAAGTDISTVEFDNWAVTWNAPVEENEIAQTITPRKSLAFGQALEPEVAQSVGRAKLRAFAQAIEAELSQTINEFKTAAVAQAVEAEQAQTVGKAKTRATGQATETEQAQAIKPPLKVNQAIEQEVAQAITPLKTRAFGQSTEAELAQSIGKAKLRAVGQVTEVEQAQQILGPRRMDQAIEAEIAQVITARKTRAVAQATEAELSQAVGKAKTRILGQSAENEIAQNIIPPAKLNQVIESELAQAIVGRKTRAVAQAVEAELAQVIRPGHLRLIGAGQETELAFAIIPRKRADVGQSTEVEMAMQITRFIVQVGGPSEVRSGANGRTRTGGVRAMVGSGKVRVR